MPVPRNRWVALRRVQRRLAGALGLRPEHLTETVTSMLASNARRAPGYWLQLYLATGIATLGLALGSTAVVIGAMLVSPLMGPIVELGMGLAVGSSLLVIRAFLRVTISVAVVIAAAAVITVLLPFHEVTAEISARTAPTLLDLLVAAFCALTAAYTTVRQTADTTAAAAGTAIGISLVPPLCVTGYGLGTRSGSIASGAALLFTANFSAILVIAVLSFLVLGYNVVSGASIEHDFLETTRTGVERAASRLHHWVSRAFAMRYGTLVRVLVPVGVLAAVYLPLQRALGEVTWQIRTRGAIRRVLESDVPRAVQTAVVVERHTVSLHLVTVGTSDSAAALERTLSHRIASLTGVDPAVSVTAVPTVEQLAAMVHASTSPDASAPTDDPLVPSDVATRLDGALASQWPAAAGHILGWALTVRPQSRIVTVHHLGPPLGAPGDALLSSALSQALSTRLTVATVALPDTSLQESDGRLTAWTTAALALASAAAQTDSAAICVTQPRTAPRAVAARITRALDSAAAGAPHPVAFTPGAAWSIRVAIAACRPPAADTSASPPRP